MLLLGTLVNAATVVVGGTLGMSFGSKIPENVNKIVFQVLGLFTCVIGISMALESESMLVVVFSLLIGGIVGTLLRLDERFDSMSERLKSRVKGGRSERFTEGLTAAFLLFCIGSMTIVGSIDEGLGRGAELLITKAVMDLFSSMMFASIFGVGVVFSAIPLVLFQGGLTMIAYFVGDVVPSYVIADLSATGGLMMLGLGLTILDIKKMNVVNMLPSLLFAVMFSLISYSILN